MQVTVNGVAVVIPREWQGETLLAVLREYLGLVGTKYGCGAGLCGACTVHVGDQTRLSCLTPVAETAGTSVVTIEGLAGPDGALHPVQEAWLAEAVPQCGYCQAGQIMASVALLRRNPNPDDADIDAALAGNLCRCGTHQRIRRAVKRVAGKRA